MFGKFAKNRDLFITVILVIGILATVNFFSYKIFHRWDLTEGKVYSISNASKGVVGELDDIVNIKVYFSKNLPSQYITIEQEVGDILDEYESYSNSKVRVEFIDPESFENPEQDLYALGIPALIFDIIEKDQRQTVKGYLGMVVEYGGDREVIPVITDTYNLEYQVTMAIKKVSSDKMPTVALLTSHGCLDTENEAQTVSKKLAELYNLESVDLSENAEIPASVDSLLILRPKEEFTEEQLKSIDSFVMRGGSLLLAVDGVTVGDNLATEVNNLGLEPLLGEYGVEISKNLVLDTNSEVVSFTMGFLPFSINYPLWPKVSQDGFDKDNAAVAKLESASFAWASGINIIKEKLGEAKVTLLAQTTKNAWEQVEGEYDLNPQQRFTPNGSIGKKNLAVAINGKLKSAFGDSMVDNARIIVVGDGDFASDNFLGRVPSNLVFLQNLVDSLSFDEDLINIRSKDMTSRPIKELTDKDRIKYRYLNVFGLTVVAVAFGMIRYYRRRKRRFEDEF